MREKNLPITPDQFRVLSHLWEKEGLQQTELAVCTNRNRANVTRIIDILERQGIAERRGDQNDRRVFKIYLTEKGHSLKKKTAQCAAQSIEDSLQGITPQEIQICTRVLQKIIKNVS